jgi:hypothetical protein
LKHTGRQEENEVSAVVKSSIVYSITERALHI